MCTMAVSSLWSCPCKTPRVPLSPGSHLPRSSSIYSLDTKLPRGCVAAAEARNANLHGSWTSGLASKWGTLLKRSNALDIFPYSKMSPFLFLTKFFNDLHIQSLTGQPSIRHQVLLGYWIGPEDVDGWGFVEAYLVPP